MPANTETRTALLLLLLLLPAGCTEEIDSTDVRTSGVHAQFSATAEGDGKTRVHAQLRVGGASSNTFLDLRPGDRLVARMAGQSVQLSGTGGHTYTAILEGDAPAAELVIAFERTDADESAPASRVELPAAFTVSAPTVAQQVSRAQSLSVLWSPVNGAGQLRYSLSGDCVESQSGTTNDDGELVIAAGAIAPRTQALAQATCDVAVVLGRVQSGTVDPAFGEGGKFEATQRRQVAFSSTP